MDTSGGNSGKGEYRSGGVRVAFGVSIFVEFVALLTVSLVEPGKEFSVGETLSRTTSTTTGFTVATLKVVLVKILLLEASFGFVVGCNFSSPLLLVVVVGISVSFWIGVAVVLDMDVESLLTTSNFIGVIGFFIDEFFFVKALLSPSVGAWTGGSDNACRFTRGTSSSTGTI